MESLKSQINILRQAISTGDTERLWREAHAIKGGAANLVADELSRLALEIEKVGKTGTLDRAEETLQEFETEFNRFEAFTKKKIGNGGN